MKNIPLHWQIMVGMLVGTLAGLAVNFWGVEVPWLLHGADFIGDLFIRCLRFVAVPIVLFSLIVGAGGLGDVQKLGRIGIKTFLLYLCTTAVSISIGLLLANFLSPGMGLTEDQQAALIAKSAETVATKIEAAQAPSLSQTLLNIVPTNPFEALAQGKMLQVVLN